MKDFKYKDDIKRALRFLQKVSGYDAVQSRKAIRSKTPLYLVPIAKEDPKYFYQMSFWTEFYEYFWGKPKFIPSAWGGV